MVDERYLEIGLDALSRAAERDFFSDGHRGAAVIAAYYLCKEQKLENATQEVIADSLDGDLKSKSLFEPSPEESGTPELVRDIVNTLGKNIKVFKMVGHDVIFSSAALKAFHQMPGAITPRRVQGICRLINCFDTDENSTVPAADDVPKFESRQQLVEFIFEEFLQALARYKGYGQGVAGHLLTFSQALIGLYELGYVDLANKGHPALGTMVSIARRGPSKDSRRIPDHAPNRWTPLDLRYWEEKQAGLSGLGHAFKYPYSFYNLMSRLDNQELKQRCEAESYKIF